MKVEFMTEKKIAFTIRRLSEDEKQAALDLDYYGAFDGEKTVNGIRFTPMKYEAK